MWLQKQGPVLGSGVEHLQCTHRALGCSPSIKEREKSRWLQTKPFNVQRQAFIKAGKSKPKAEVWLSGKALGEREGCRPTRELFSSA